MKPTKADRAHFAKVAAMRCLVCGAWPVELHHVIGYATKMGRAPKLHTRICPLCPRHHNVQDGPRESVHAMGHRKFFETYGVDLMAIAEELANGASRP